MPSPAPFDPGFLNVAAPTNTYTPHTLSDSFAPEKALRGLFSTLLQPCHRIGTESDILGQLCNRKVKFFIRSVRSSQNPPFYYMGVVTEGA